MSTVWNHESIRALFMQQHGGPITRVWSVGRDYGADVRYMALDTNVEAFHAAVALYEDGSYWVADLGSHHGTFIDSYRLPARTAHMFRPGNVLRIGQYGVIPSGRDSSTCECERWRDGITVCPYHGTPQDHGLGRYGL